MRYREFFTTATGFEPFGFQVRYANSSAPPILLAIPTGLGKTETTVLPFIHGTVFASDLTPRRLVYVLPMRSLVEQTLSRVQAWCKRLKNAGLADLPQVAALLGGDVDDIWIEAPDKPWILIGTQDMILSRALNRAYAASQFLWPVGFAFLNNDAHWIVDEVQLQGVGVRTAAQLQGLRAKLGTFGDTRVTFVSATLERSWVDTVDHPLGEQSPFQLGDADRTEPDIAKRLGAPKRVHRLSATVADVKPLGQEIAQLHRAGSLTLVVVNQVAHAQALARALRRIVDPAIVELLHGRFRPPDRARIAARALSPVDRLGPGRIVVSTQVVEAGVDIDARTLVSELAPWASIVQRLGRCNRRGEHDDARFGWIDLDDTKDKERAPYERDDLAEARALLEALEGGNAAPRDLPHVRLPLTANATLRRADLLDLFDTAPDISGNDVDVSRFIRETDDFTVSVFWRDAPPHGDDRVRRDELCPAPFVDMREFIERLRKQQHWDAVRVRAPLAASDDDLWRVATPADVRRGGLMWIRSAAGGYDPDEGFAPDAKRPVPPVEIAEPGLHLDEETNRAGGDRGTWIGTRVRLKTHAEDAGACARDLVTALTSRVGPAVAETVVRAAQWHDAGKVHPVFQATMQRTGLPAADGPWAKSERPGRHARLHFRHELVSLLGWLREHDGGRENDLIAYLVAAHHGKLRVTAYPYPGEAAESVRTILGVTQGDEVPAFDLSDDDRSPTFTVDLALFDVGSLDGSPTWTDRVLALRDDPDLGPFRLAYLESLVRVADWRASALRRETPEVFA